MDVGVSVWLGVGVIDGVFDDVGVNVSVGVCVHVGLVVWVGDELGEAVKVLVGESVWVNAGNLVVSGTDFGLQPLKNMDIMYINQMMLLIKFRVFVLFI